VVEADESDGSIEKYVPYVAVVNNITIDHKEISELKKLFGDFVQKATGGAVINADCDNSQCLQDCNPHIKTFSVKNPQADFYASNIKPLPHGISYNLDGKTFSLQIIGAFNVANALAAIAACSYLGVDKFAAAKILQEFTGTQRRLDVIGTANNIMVIDDFAHNPDKVLASMRALRDYSGRLLIMFQPHGFSPMRMMGKQIMESFAKTMQPDDCLFMPEIYYAGGTVTRDISSADLIKYASELGVNAKFYQTRDEIKNEITAMAKSGDRIVIMGARDNTLPDFCRSILEGVKA
jgi:UDP-N-acetylmuramate--alanine ligase